MAVLAAVLTVSNWTLKKLKPDGMLQPRGGFIRIRECFYILQLPYSYPIPSYAVDYDSLYIARLLWVDSAGNKHYINDGDCYFTLQPTPSALLYLEAVNVTSSSITWIWDKPSNHGNKVAHYQVSRNRPWSAVNVITGTYYKWTGLSENTRYSIRVRAVTGSGNYGSWSSWEYVSTLPPVPRSPSVSIDNSVITSRSVVLALSRCTGAGIVKYRVKYSFDGGNQLTAESDNSFDVTELRPDTQYTFTVSCVNSAGMTGPNITRFANTLSEDTLQPVISSVQISDSLDFASIVWNAPSAPVTVTGYDVRVVAHVGGIPAVYLMATNRPWYSRIYGVIQRFIPETVYTFQVRAQTSVGTSQWSTPVVRSTLPAVPPNINGLTASFPTSTSIALSWTQTAATIEYFRLTLHNVAANTTEHYDLFYTVNSSIFHNLSPNTAYSVTVTAVNKAGSGPTASLNVTTLGPDGAASPLAVATGTLGAMVVIVIVAVPLLIGFTWWVSKVKRKKLNRSDSDYNCELQESVAYVKNPLNMPWTQGSCSTEEEEECEGENASANGVVVELKSIDPQIPSRKYLQEKKKGPTVFASIPVFDEMDFKEKSGWYKPTVADVIAEKLGVNVAAFPDHGSGVYFMCHRTKKQAKWVGLSPDLCRTLCGLFFQLYQKDRSELNPLEVELKFFSPFAADWDIKVWTADPKDLVLERAKKIVEYKTLKPLGLNNALKFTTMEMWEDFTSWFVAQKRQQ